MDSIRDGLTNEFNPRIDDAIRNQRFYEGKTEQYIRYRDAENVWDHEQKPKRTTNITRRAVNALCEHLYVPGPARRVENSEEADAWLQSVYEANHVNAKFLRADRLSTLNDVAMFQVAAAGTDATLDPNVAEAMGDAPLIIHVRGSEEFAVWCSPETPTKPWAVCVISMYDETRQFQLWTATNIYTFKTEKLGLSQTTGGRVARYVPEESGENPYGILPFSFFHYELPVRDFWNDSPGTDIANANYQLNMDMTDTANSVSIYRNKMMLAYNVRSDWKPIFTPGCITHVPGMPNQTQTGLEPRIEALEGTIDIGGSWQDMDEYRSVIYEDNGIPEAAIRMKQQSAASGIAILSEQAPLLTRAQARRSMAMIYEKDLARVCFAVSGAYYDIPENTEVAAQLQLSCTWSEPEIPIPGPERDQADEWEVANNYASEVTVLMRRRGLSRDAAKAELEQVMEDKKWMNDMKKKYGLDQASFFGANGNGEPGSNGQPGEGRFPGASPGSDEEPEAGPGAGPGAVEQDKNNVAAGAAAE